METKNIVIISIILILLSGFILVKNFNSQVIATGTEDSITLNLSEYKTCCTYVDEKGEEKSCIIQNRFDCSVCEITCS